jgi:hypothetical protein
MFPPKRKSPTNGAKHLKTVYCEFHAIEPDHVIVVATDDGSAFKGAVNKLNNEV